MTIHATTTLIPAESAGTSLVIRTGPPQELLADATPMGGMRQVETAMGGGGITFGP